MKWSWIFEVYIHWIWRNVRVRLRLKVGLGLGSPKCFNCRRSVLRDKCMYGSTTFKDAFRWTSEACRLSAKSWNKLKNDCSTSNWVTNCRSENRYQFTLGHGASHRTVKKWKLLVHETFYIILRLHAKVGLDRTKIAFLRCLKHEFLNYSLRQVLKS